MSNQNILESVIVTVIGGVLAFIVWSYLSSRVTKPTGFSPANYSGYSYAPYTYTKPDVYGSDPTIPIQPAGPGLQELFGQEGTRWIGLDVAGTVLSDFFRSSFGGAKNG
jgi:hypothetical protein